MKIMILVIALVGCGQEPTGQIQGPRAVVRLITDSTRQFQEAKIFLTQPILDIRQLLGKIEKMKLTEKRKKIQLIRRALLFDTDAIKKLINRSEINIQVKRQLNLAKQWRAVELELTKAESIANKVLDELHEAKLKIDKQMFLSVYRSGRTVPDYDNKTLMEIENDAIHKLIDQEQLNVGKLVVMIDEGLNGINTARKLAEQKLNKLLQDIAS